MQLILFIFLKTSRMKTNWKNIALRVIEMILTGAAGGAATQLL